MKRSPSGNQLSPNHEQDSSDLLVGDAGIDSIQQLLEKGSTERRERKQPSGNPGVATFTGRIDRSGSNAGQPGGEVPKPQKPASAGMTSGGSEINPPGGFFSMPPSLADKEPSQSPFFEDHPARRQSISNGHIGKAASSREPQRPPPATRNSDSTDQSGHTEKKLQHPTNSSATNATGSGLPNPNRAPVGQPQGQVNEVNYRHRPGGESIDAATSFSSSKDKDKKPGNTLRPADRIAQEKRDRLQSGLKQPKPQSVGKGPMPGLARSEGSESRKNEPHLELDEQGEQQLIRDFSGIVRLGNLGSSSGNGTATGGVGTGSGTGTGSKGQSSNQNDNRAQQQSAAGARDTTRSSVLNFVEDQANTENMSDPNAPTPSQAASLSDYASTGISVPDTPPPRPVSDARRPSAQQDRPDSRNQTESSESSFSNRDSSEMASASGREEEEDSANESDEEEPIVTFRFEHSQNTDGHHVVVGREGILRRCEDEPITTPGAVQGFGVLMVLEEDYETGDLIVRQVSEVSRQILPGVVLIFRTQPNCSVSRQNTSSASLASPEY